MMRQKIQNVTRYFGQEALPDADVGHSETPGHSTERQIRLRSEIITRIEKQGIPLKNWDVAINNGVRTGFNKAFIIDGNTKNRLAQDPKNAELLRPVLTGKDIRKWKADFKDQWLIGTFPSLNIDIDQYHGIEEYLSTCRERLEPKPKSFKDKWKGRKSGSYKWFEIQNSIAYHENFEKAKIIWHHLALSPEFALDTEHFYLTAPSNLLTMKNSTNPQDIKYLLAVLNSKISDYYMRQTGRRREGGCIEYKKISVEKIPIRRISPSEQELFVTLADYILFLRKIESTLTTAKDRVMSSFFEQITDGCVYESYFKESLKDARKDILKYLDDLPAVTPTASQDQTLALIRTVFTRLYDRDHPVSQRLYYLDSVREVRIIKGLEVHA